MFRYSYFLALLLRLSPIRMMCHLLPRHGKAWSKIVNGSTAT
jgi:hypothetical protein